MSVELPSMNDNAELEELRRRLQEAEQTLHAIRNGEVDSVIVSGRDGDRVFSLQGADAPYRAFVEQMLEGAVTLTPEGMILYCNRRFAEMVRTPLERVIGSPVRSFVHPEGLEPLEIRLNDRGGKVRLNLTASDGSFIPAQLSFSRMPIEDAEAVCMVVTDLTEQEEKRELAIALEKLRAAQDQLKRQNQDLAAARASAVAANDAKDEFLASLSHELRTPLTPILMVAGALSNDQKFPAEYRNYVSIIRRNAEMEARLIDDLLDITRIVRGKIELKLETVDLHQVLARALETCQSDMTAKRLNLNQDLQAPNCRVTGDTVRLQQVLWNLIRNAVKFTSEGGSITVRTTNDGGQITLSVIDTGIGIDAMTMGRLFNPFEQGDRSITQRFGGLGLGLTISKRLTEMLGGQIGVHSDGPGKGATFTVALPCVDAPLSAPMRVATANNTTPGVRILLVEDHDDTRSSLSQLLRMKYTVCDVANISAALAAANNGPFDLVISDLGLPDGSGLELMRQLRDQYKMHGICLSGFGMEEDLARSAAAGFRHHLTKPIDFDRLQAMIEGLTKN